MEGKASSKRRKKAVMVSSTSLEPPPAAEVIAGSVDLLTEILVRLPAKPLIRFKCVSKHWRSLVSDPQFARNHSRRNPRPLMSGLYFKSGYGEIGSVSFSGSSTLPTLPSPHGVLAILHSCNGLLLVTGYGNKHRFIVCNPTTQKHFVIPPSPHRRGSYGSAFLAFDPSKSRHYKVVWGSRCSPGIEIYSSESGCWKRIPTQNGGYENGVFWRGAIHWLRHNEKDLLRFEIEEERMIANPKILSHHEVRYFGECGGRLLLIQAPEPSGSGFRILAMEEGYSRWTVNCWVDLRPLVREFPNDGVTRYGECSVLCVFEGEEEKDFALVLVIPGKLISYNPKRKTWNVLQQWAPGEKTGYGYAVKFDRRYPFVPSLSPV